MRVSRSRAVEDVRFGFGKNWRRFLSVVDEGRVTEAERSLTRMLGPAALVGKTFLDVGCGSGLFSLAAVRLGAARVHSFDFDWESVACAAELKKRFAPGAHVWTMEQGSALDAAYLAGLGLWQVVYSWGVLHHTGDMWRAMDRVARLVAPRGKLFISIYNDQGRRSKRWLAVKKFYNVGFVARCLVLGTFVPVFVLLGLARDLSRFRNPLARYREYWRSRGMSVVHDCVDWLGGFPFEVAAPNVVVEFMWDRCLELSGVKTCGRGSGCNEFVFTKS